MTEFSPAGEKMTERRNPVPGDYTRFPDPDKQKDETRYSQKSARGC
jgi:hypothetical protein